ncbi:MAG TPA: 2-amino-4-hydroxy-6-hydroxymethyldihydropteridine diphosphokinase [Acidobacteriota bacterium]|nr:2-amino-4-hydroxy-6-hydroxymethyldihydropteridine diphosphokinase [Acidobacteriota bacterium]
MPPEELSDREAERPNRGDEAIFLAFGSNLGRRRGWIEQAAQALLRRGVALQRCSSLYDTAPREVTDQPRFLNQVCRAASALSPLGLLEVCLQVEQALGRRRRRDKGPRNIDIDILYYGGRKIDHPRLQIPHPRLAERAFVMVPLAEIAPDWVDPTSGLAVRRMLERLGPQDETLHRLD